VEGTTVKLTGGFVGIPEDLTVPAGVTLDVTAGGAALGLGSAGGYNIMANVILTVNGTVIAGPDYIRLEDNAIAATINGSGTIRLKGKGSLLSVEGNSNVDHRTLTLDGVTLAGLPDNTDSLVVVRSGGVGKTGTFVMKSGKITGNTTNDGGGVRVENGGTFTMEDGTISGNTANQGGGVSVADGGTFTMKGGEISGNTANEEGGGVKVADNCTFTMKGGAISNNRADFRGGGVLVQWDGNMFTMEDGAISGNTANEGGGVSVADGGTFTMEGGEIFGNTANEQGGGVKVADNCMFTLKGGRVQGNADSDGFAKNTAGTNNAALDVSGAGVSATWGTGGTYTKGGATQTGGTDIDNSDDTLIATP
jgi:hypothetical protein